MVLPLLYLILAMLIDPLGELLTVPATGLDKERAPKCTETITSRSKAHDRLPASDL